MVSSVAGVLLSSGVVETESVSSWVISTAGIAFATASRSRSRSDIIGERIVD